MAESEAEREASMETEEPDTAEEEAALDLEKMARDYAQYAVVNSKQDKQVLDERIEGVVFRVEEFKQQLVHLHDNIATSSDKMAELQSNTAQLAQLFQRVDQVEAFLSVVSKNVDQLEESISKAEKELDPSKLRKVFSTLPGLRKKAGIAPPSDSGSSSSSSSSWQPPQVFQARDYFSSSSSAPSQSVVPPDQRIGGATADS